ncbi:MAG: hypothetical protein WCF19_01720 [Chlamydiales bacterium]
MSIWRRSWWVLFFCAAAAVLHVHFLKEKKNDLRLLSDRLEEMESEKLQALAIHEDLELKIASQTDPAWIEMVLIRDLGVVPEGFFKVHFKK